MFVRSINRFGRNKQEILKEWHWLINPNSARNMVDGALEAGIRVASTGYLWADGSAPADGKREFIIGFAGIEAENIEPGIAALARVWETFC